MIIPKQADEEILAIREGVDYYAIRECPRKPAVVGINWHNPRNVIQHSARGGVATFSGTWIKFAIQLVTTVVIARILGPSEYGVAAIIVVFGGIAELIRDSGLTTLIIQRKILSSKIASSLNAMNIFIGSSVAGVVYICGPSLASEFGDNRFRFFAPLLGIMFALSGVAAVPSALLARNLEFRRLAVIDVTAVIASCSVGLITATAGFGATAIVLQAVSSTVVQSVFSIAWCPWRPGPFASMKELKRYLIHASSISLVKILNYAAGKVDNLVVGAFAGTRSAGLYNQAYQLMVLPLTLINGPIQRIFIPTMSRLVHDPDLTKASKFFRGMISIVTSLLWPSFAILAIFSEDVIVFLFGEPWRESASLFTILVLAGVSQTLGYVNTWLFFASGQAERNTWWTLLSRPIMISVFFIGVQWGALGVTVALTLVSILEVWPGFLLVRVRARLKRRDLLVPLLWPSLLALLAGMMSLAVRYIFPARGNSLIALADIGAVMIGTITVAFLIGPIRVQLFQLGEKLRHARAG